jgi:hypothetical protein
MSYIFEIMDEMFYPDPSIRREIKSMDSDEFIIYKSIDDLCSEYIGYKEYNSSIIHHYKLRENISVNTRYGYLESDRLSVVDLFDKGQQVWIRSSAYISSD